MDSKYSVDIGIFLTNLTDSPGVYRMLDVVGNILYVGKASNLKKRVSSYFSKSVTHVKTRALVSQIASIDISVTRNETEAFLLESSLIKSLRPKYNILMRDDKSYPFIHIAKGHDFARMKLMRAKKKPENGEFFGPYPSTTAVRETLSILQKVFKIRNCRDSFFSARSRPCLQYQINRCSAPCTGLISVDNYKQSLTDAINFLQGKSQNILDELAMRMDKAVALLAFEEAAVLRDQIKSLRLVQEAQSVVNIRGDADIIVIEARAGFACVQCVSVRDGDVLASQKFFPEVPVISLENDEADDLLWQHVFEVFIAYYYIDTPERIPALILTNHIVDEKAALQLVLTELRGRACKIQSKPRGVNARWVDFAVNNLQRSVAEHTLLATTMQARYNSLCELIHRDTKIVRMECFDISHTQGEATVASCVVFDEHGPCKRAYRQFNISGITLGDDYAAMEQAITRRFKSLIQNNDLPDVLIIDGGKGQLNVALKVFKALGVEGVTCLGIAKGPSRKAGWERLIINDASQEITLPHDSHALHLLQHIRDESHRFAITAHRKKRQKISFESSLECIDGIGTKRRKALLTRFGGLRDLAKASIVEITKVHGISGELAARIYQHFHAADGV